jgi:hypothetical protein
MAEEVKTPPAAPAAATADDIKNVKSEFDRKLGNLEKTNQALLAQLQVLNQPKPQPAPAKKPLKDLWYDDPEAAASIIAKKASDDTLAIIGKENAIQARKGNVIQGLYREYPELQDYDHPLTIKAVEIFEKLTDEEKANPIAYKLAVREAAEELEIKTKAKRKPKDEEDSFSLGGSGGKTEKGTRAKRSSDLDPKTVEFARLAGLDVKDEKVLTNLKKHNDRKNWMTWE